MAFALKGQITDIGAEPAIGRGVDPLIPLMSSTDLEALAPTLWPFR